MSTKTTIKRIALVAVSALGLGMFSSVSPASAAGMASTDGTGATVSVSASVSGSQALRKDVASKIVVKFTGPAVTAYSDETGTVNSSTTGGYASSAIIIPNMVLLTKPATSTVAVTKATTSANVTGTKVTTTDFSGDGYASNDIAPLGLAIALSAKKSAVYAGFTFTPDVVGTYTFQIWDDVNRDGLLGGSTEKLTTATFVVTDAISTLAASAVINNASTLDNSAGSYGAVIAITAKDANGNPTVPSGAESIKVSTTGSAKWRHSFNLATSTDVSGAGGSDAYLSYSDFNSQGVAYLGLTDGTAETVSITMSQVGGTATPTYTSATATFVTPTTYIADNSKVAANALVTDTVKSTANAYKVSAGATASLTITAAAASKKAAVAIVESSGLTYGYATNAIKGITVLTADADKLISFSRATSSTLGSKFYIIVGTTDETTNPTTTTGTITKDVLVTSVLSYSTSSVGLDVTPANMTVATGSRINFTATLTDRFGAVRSGVAVKVDTISGRNATTAVASAITNADGVATLTLTDASTSTTSLTDTVTFSAPDGNGSTVTDSVTINYVANLTVSTVTVTSSDSTKSVANLTTNPSVINAGKSGASASTTAIYAYVTTTAGALAGIPVTFSVAGTGAAIPSTSVTAYTDSTGMATSAIYGWVTGKYTVTATAGGVSGTGVHAFAQANTAYARTVSATATGSVVTAAVKDRYGNGISGVTIYATATGGAYFGDGKTSTSGQTGLAGTADFVVNGAGSVSVSTTNPADATQAALGQTNAPKGYANNSASATTLATLLFTAYAAGTTSTAETGVGASYDAAGVASASVDVASITTSDSIDAANEATDAANAATDAANAAAEAADAATAAAQDAQAAVAELATQVAALIAGIKAQITTLTNLVIKIQKKVKA